MAYFTKAALEDLQSTYPLKGMPSTQRDQAIRVVLTQCAPGCLLPDYEIYYVIQKLARGDRFTDSYSFKQNEGCIMLQLPDLYNLEQKIYAAEEALKAAAQQLLATMAENERIAANAAAELAEPLPAVDPLLPDAHQM